MRIRAFPVRTAATPEGADVVTGLPGLFDSADQVDISVTFSWDVPLAERMMTAWERRGARVSVGGPAMGTWPGDFVPGQWLAEGYVITSRGCGNRCPHCDVWRSEGGIRELPICDGHNVLDSNLLACSETHIRAVFAMLARQRLAPQFTGGLEAALLQGWHLDLMLRRKPAALFCAYDEPSDLEPLIRAGRMLWESGLSVSETGDLANRAMAYVLVGHRGDTLDKARARMSETYRAGFWPRAMLFRPKQGPSKHGDPAWRKFARTWSRMASIKRILKKGVGESRFAAVTSRP